MPLQQVHQDRNSTCFKWYFVKSGEALKEPEWAVHYNGAGACKTYTEAYLCSITGT